MLSSALKAEVSCATSSIERPFTAAAIIEADDWLIEHPCPVKRRSRMLPSSTSTVTTTSSPHSGLKPSMRNAGGGSSPLRRGFL